MGFPRISLPFSLQDFEKDMRKGETAHRFAYLQEVIICLISKRLVGGHFSNQLPKWGNRLVLVF